MNDSLCAAFRQLSGSTAYHILNVVKVILCSAGAIRIAMQWKQYPSNLKCVVLRMANHSWQKIPIRGIGIAALYSCHHIILLISLERLYSAFYPAYFEKSSSKLLSGFLASTAIFGTSIFCMIELSQNFQLFRAPKIYVALMTVNIPENKLGFQNLMRMVAISNCLGLITLCFDLYVNFIRKRARINSLAISYQRSENRKIVLTLLPIEFTHTMMGFFTGFSLFMFGKLVSNPTPITQQLFVESVAIVVYFPLILSFFINRSVKIPCGRPSLIVPTIDHFELLRSSWDDEFDKMKNSN